MRSLIIYYGMGDSRKGDYYRYLAEFKTDQERKEAADQSLKGYEACLFIFILPELNGLIFIRQLSNSMIPC